MRSTIIKIVLSFVIVAVCFYIDFPIEIQNKPIQIVFTHLLFLIAFAMMFFNYKAGGKLQRPLNWISHIINSFYLVVVGYIFLWIVMFDFSGYFPVWTDQKVYINQADTTQIMVEQEYRISGSIIDWRVRKVKGLARGIRWSRPTSTDSLNGEWRFIDKEGESDDIRHFKSGKAYPIIDSSGEHVCDLDKFLNNPNILPSAKDVYSDKEWNLDNDTFMLRLLDSLFAKDNQSRSFYFKVVTKTCKKSDGYYSEALGSRGKEYIDIKTKEFLNHFINNPCFTQDDLMTWADIEMLYFSLRAEDGNKMLVDDYLQTLDRNCDNCTSSQMEVLKRFSEALNGKWKAYTKAK
jgi:hypothetical protein